MSWVVGDRALFTQLMMIVLTCSNIVRAIILWKICGFFLPWICIPLLSLDVDPTWHLSTIVDMQLTLYNMRHNVINLR
jgi:hypothetical protein